ncbi:MAG: hypothetical protein LQ351_003994 [Letrouitia transgressa]|nr:MAG: hypothetical protein LQ351_003994 [Letrouitia transgressa]
MHILIIGAGPTGLSLALSLLQSPHKENHTFAVYEARSEASTIGGAVNLTPTALRYLDGLHVLPKLLARGATVKAIEIFSLHSGSKLSEVNFSKPEYGYSALRIKRSDLLSSLLETLFSYDRAVQWGKKLVSINDIAQEEKVEAVFSDGQTAKGDLIVGCDGIHSPTRTCYVEPDRNPRYTGQCVAFGFLEGVKGPLFFKDTGLLSSQNGSLLATYCTADRSTLFFGAVMRVPDEASREGWRLKGEDRENVKKDMQRRFGALVMRKELECVKTMLREVQDVCLYPVHMLSYPAQAMWAKNRVVLMGDAAHAMPPQGESTGFCIEDAILFARVLERRGQGGKRDGSEDEVKACARSEDSKEDAGRKENMTVPELCKHFETLRKPRMEEAVKESHYRWKGAHAGSWLAFKIQEYLTPWFLYFTEGKRDREFCSDVREKKV